jgi:hypothetical protein
MADEDLVISIDDDAEIRTTETEGATDAVADLKSQLATLEEQTKAERERAAAAERRASEEAQRANRATEEVKSARTEITDRELDTVVSGIAAAQAEADAAQKDFEAAAESGDFKKQGEAQRRIARAEAKLLRLDESKADIEVRRADTEKQTRTPNATTEPARREPAVVDPIEAVLSQMRPETAAWIRANPDYGMALARDAAGRASKEDVRRANKLRAAHNDALADGYGQDTPEYFRHVENFVGITNSSTKAQRESTNGAGRQQQQNGSGERTRRASPSVAPVSGTGSGAGGNGNGGTEVRLSAKEADAARDGTHVWNPGNKHPKTGEPIKRDDPLVGQPIGTREFAKRKLAMQREGHYDRVYLEQ